MQRQRSANNSFAETIDLNQGSVSSNDGVNQPTAWNSMLYPMDTHSVRSFGGWQIGESSTSTSTNSQSQGIDGNLKTENSFSASPMPEARVGPSNALLRESLSRPLSLQSSGSTRMPLNINLNAEHMGNGNDGGQEPERLLTPDSFRYNFEASGNSYYPENIDGCSASSLGDWGSSFKRKNLEGGSSSCFHQGDSFDQPDYHACYSGPSSSNTSLPPVASTSFSHSEELSLRIGIGRGVASDIFLPRSVTERGESSSRNLGNRVNQGNHDLDQFNFPLARNSRRQSDLYSRHQTPRLLSLSDFTISRPVSSNARAQSQSIRTPDLSRNMPSFPWNGAANSRASGTSSSVMRSTDRGISSGDEAHLASYTRNSMEHTPFVPPSDIRTNWNLSPESARNSASHFPSTWATSQHHGSARNLQRSSQFYPWAPFPSLESEHGDWRSQFPILQTEPSSSSEGSIRSNQGHHRTMFPRSAMLDLPGDDVSAWHALAADIGGRQRLVSELRHVLTAMRRGENLRDEDYMLFDPFLNGIAEFHDRHRDMRLDVDNMSYEELLALEESIGDVNTGLSEEAIMKSMPQRKHFCLMDHSSPNKEPCSICREDYIFGDNIGKLDCGHDFHTDCIKQWLTQKNLCPICKMTALSP